MNPNSDSGYDCIFNMADLFSFLASIFPVVVTRDAPSLKSVFLSVISRTT